MFPIKVKTGQRVELDHFQGVKYLRREVSTGNQIFHFEGKHKGSFVDENGKQIKSVNYEIQDGMLVIKKFTKDDVGVYAEYPTVVHKTRNPDGSWSALPGLSIYYSI
ncbi:hypothetical protein B9Z55_005303 [Caenorhabditis nigoni]|nr:hypothetical protein B9Z55_005303 [Caenorhabditis nigoni]